MSNNIPLRAKRSAQNRGGHLTQAANKLHYGKDWSTINARTTDSGFWQGTRVHEYVHHLQEAMPDLDKLFRLEHRRRTKGEKLIEIYPKEYGRKDQYIDEYQGREYSKDDGGALEVMTMAYQYLYQVKDPYLPELVQDDPGMLDLAIGALFKYDPNP